MIKIFGHISPDTDATCSAIIWNWFVNNHTSNESKPYVLGALNKETKFVLSRWGFDEPELLESILKDDKVMIVDTNNPQELFANINESKILEIVDHHKLVGGLYTDSPISVYMKPLASTASVIFDLMQIDVEKLPKEIAGLILSCILSDTLMFRSPTTTPHDKDIALKLAEYLDIKIEEYANEMFEAKSDVSDFTDIGLINLDSKKFEVGDKNIKISVIETTNPQTILDRKSGLITSMKEILEQEKDVDDILLFVVDIFKEESTVFTYNQFTKDIIEASFEVSAESDTEVLPNIISRKKQIVPNLKLKQ